MIPIASAAAGLALDHLVQQGLDKLSNRVIERWSRQRAVSFYRTLIWHLSQDIPDRDEVEARLNRAVEDEATSEVIFDAYRAVSLSRSKTLGPRVIAVLTSRIIQRDSPVATGSEEMVFAAAEALSDVDFRCFMNTIDLVIAGAANNRSDPGVYNDTAPLEYSLPTPSSQLPFAGWGARSRSATQTIVIENSLAASLGLWAERLRAIGLISEVRTNRLKMAQGDRSHHEFVELGTFVKKPDAEWKIRFNEAAHLLRDILKTASAEASDQNPCSVQRHEG